MSTVFTASPKDKTKFVLPILTFMYHNSIRFRKLLKTFMLPKLVLLLYGRRVENLVKIVFDDDTKYTLIQNFALLSTESEFHKIFK